MGFGDKITQADVTTSTPTVSAPTTLPTAAQIAPQLENPRAAKRFRTQNPDARKKALARYF